MPDLHEYPPTPRVNGPGNAAPSSHLGLGINSGRITPPPALCIDGGGFRDQKPRFGALGDAAASDAVLAEFIEKYEKEWAYNIAYVLAFRGEVDRAFEWLAKAVVYNDPGLSQIAIQPLFANIRDDPRWLPFLESIGKSPEQLAAIEFNVTLPE